MKEHKENPALERLAAETILQRGVKVKIPAPFFLRWIRRTWVLRMTCPTLGTLMRVSAYYTSTGITDDKLENLTFEQAQLLVQLHGKAISKAVAVALLNGRISGRWLTRPLARHLRWNLTAQELMSLASVLLIYGGASDFMTTTRSVRRMKMTSPNLGQKMEQGS